VGSRAAVGLRPATIRTAAWAGSTVGSALAATSQPCSLWETFMGALPASAARQLKYRTALAVKQKGRRKHGRCQQANGMPQQAWRRIWRRRC